jgi:lysozyme family protein
MTSEQRFQTALMHVLGVEGGFGDVERDRGGATNWGVSLRFARLLARLNPARWLRRLDRDGDGRVTAADVRKLPLDVAVDVYRAEFWDRYRCAELPWPAALLFFSYVVNMAPGIAVGVLQRAVNYAGGSTAVDGVMGPHTVRQAARCDAAELCKRLEASASETYADLDDADAFERGWQYRSADALWHAALEHRRLSDLAPSIS